LNVTSNIDGVIYRCQRHPQDIRKALAATLRPEEWAEALRREAKTTLWAIARQPEWSFVESFTATALVFAAPLQAGFVARLTNPLPPALAIEDFMMARGLQTRALKDGSGATLFSDFLNQFDQLMTDWVATEKHKDKRDWDKSDEEIGAWIGHLMLTPDGQLSATPSGPGRVSEQEAKRRLLPYIADYLARRQAAKRLDSATANAWLRAVLAAWSALVRREFGPRFRNRLQALRQELPV